MQKYRFAFVSNSMEVANTVRAFADPEQIELTVRLATMEQAVPEAQKLLTQGIEIILGGGATGKLLRKIVDEPVVTIARSHLDVLRALRKAKEYGTHVALTSFADPLSGLDVFAELLGLEITEIVFTTTPELVQGIRDAVGAGAKCVVGSGICREIAQSLGCEGVVIVPGAEVIIRCLGEAMAIAASRRKERARAERLRVVLESVNEGVVGVDESGKVNVINRTAVALLGLNPVASLGKVLPERTLAGELARVLAGGPPVHDQVCSLGGEAVVASYLPVQVESRLQGAVATFKPASRFKSISRKVERDSLRGFSTRYDLEDLAGGHPLMLELKAKAQRYARSDANILIQGETGTGKEVLAQAIHRLSSVNSKPFVAVNCSALPEALLESELFGYEEGAFTGAKRGGKQGLFEMAQGGTVFLDELADISSAMQVKLLRVLEEKTVMRLGGDRMIPVRARVLASSHRDLAQEARRGLFRADLYYRLSVLLLRIPPLRKRAEDIPGLARALAARHGLDPKRLPERVLTGFSRYSWPGNVRELDALMRRFSILAGDYAHTPDKDEAMLGDLFAELLAQETPDSRAQETGEANSVEHVSPERKVPTSGAQPQMREGGDLRQAMEAFEMNYIRNTLRDCHFNRQETAHRLGVSVNTLWRKLRQ